MVRALLSRASAGRAPHLHRARCRARCSWPLPAFPVEFSHRRRNAGTAHAARTRRDDKSRVPEFSLPVDSDHPCVACAQVVGWWPVVAEIRRLHSRARRVGAAWAPPGTGLDALCTRRAAPHGAARGYDCPSCCGDGLQSRRARFCSFDLNHVTMITVSRCCSTHFLGVEI